MRLVRFLILTLALSACRSTPAKRSPKPATSDAGAPTLAAPVPSASSAPSVFIDTGFPDPRGNILLVGPTITSLTPDGKQRFQIDLRNGPQSEASATLGLDGTSFYVRTPRALTKLSGL